MALTKDKVREILLPGDLRSRSYPLASGVELFEGALVGVDTSGYAKEAAVTLKFVGVAKAHAKNPSATAVADDIYVDCDYGHIERFENSNAKASQVNAKLYAQADDTVSITSGSGVAEVGKVITVKDGSYYDVRLRGDLS